jgi:nucleoside-diphosphate-sugar epimerase
MKILVTGASGFVGGSFMRRFAGRKGLDLFGVGRRRANFDRYAQLDLSKEFDVPFSPDVVIHAAARASPWGTTGEFFLQNVQATQNVVRFCERRGCPKLIYLSSSSVFYRHEHQFDLTEDSPIGPAFINEYAATKYAGESSIRGYAGPAVVLRPRAVFGPGDTVLFPRILRAARCGRFPLLKSEAEPAVGDLIFIDTLCDYLLAAAVQPKILGDYNLTNAKPVVIQDFILDAFARLGVRAPTRRISVATAMGAARVTEGVYRMLHLKSEPPITRYGVSVFAYSKTFHVARMLRELGPPSVSLEEGMERFIAWQRAQP